ncbi:hypothetical protein [Paraburkholderia bannensis]|uniref:hypothetical protein n=1 Tax=Paraburkholderia bannensis TaxID=765414 RepID=UPI002ABE8A7A|nr:hypothetical protein [Paraburkholderia bannensis]
MKHIQKARPPLANLETVCLVAQDIVTAKQERRPEVLELIQRLREGIGASARRSGIGAG